MADAAPLPPDEVRLSDQGDGVPHARRWSHVRRARDGVRTHAKEHVRRRRRERQLGRGGVRRGWSQRCARHPPSQRDRRQTLRQVPAPGHGRVV